MVEETRKVAGYTPKPIVFNEDDHFNFDQDLNNFTSAIGAYASWGYFDYRMKDEGLPKDIKVCRWFGESTPSEKKDFLG
jgi:hypothetical protein